MSRKIFIAAAIAAGVSATPAFAQDNWESSPDDFYNGLYVGGTFSLDAIDDNGDQALAFDTDQDGTFEENVRTVTGANAFSPGFCSGAAVSPRPRSCSDDDNGNGYSVRVGFDQRMGDGPFVAGLLIEGAKSESTDFSSGFSTTPASYTVGRGVDYSVAARGRLGFSPGEGRGLFYVTGGLAYARIDHEFATSNTANSFTEMNDDKMQWGGQIGAGAELIVAGGFSIGLEYLYQRFDDEDYFVAVGPGSAGPTNPFLLRSGGTNLRPSDTDLNIHSLRATVGFHF